MEERHGMDRALGRPIDLIAFNCWRFTLPRKCFPPLAKRVALWQRDRQEEQERTQFMYPDGRLMVCKVMEGLSPTVPVTVKGNMSDDPEEKDERMDAGDDTEMMALEWAPGNKMMQPCLRFDDFELESLCSTWSRISQTVRSRAIHVVRLLEDCVAAVLDNSEKVGVRTVAAVQQCAQDCFCATLLHQEDERTILKHLRNNLNLIRRQLQTSPVAEWEPHMPVALEERVPRNDFNSGPGARETGALLSPLPVAALAPATAEERKRAQEQQRFKVVAKPVCAYVAARHAFSHSGNGGEIVTKDAVIRVCPSGLLTLQNLPGRSPGDHTASCAGILVHEASHLALHTRDHAYGRKYCSHLARPNALNGYETGIVFCYPKDAVQNAAMKSVLRELLYSQKSEHAFHLRPLKPWEQEAWEKAKPGIASMVRHVSRSVLSSSVKWIGERLEQRLPEFVPAACQLKPPGVGSTLFDKLPAGASPRSGRRCCNGRGAEQLAHVAAPGVDEEREQRRRRNYRAPLPSPLRERSPRRRDADPTMGVLVEGNAAAGAGPRPEDAEESVGDGFADWPDFPDPRPDITLTPGESVVLVNNTNQAGALLVPAQVQHTTQLVALGDAMTPHDRKKALQLLGSFTAKGPSAAVLCLSEMGGTPTPSMVTFSNADSYETFVEVATACVLLEKENLPAELFGGPARQGNIVDDMVDCEMDGALHTLRRIAHSAAPCTSPSDNPLHQQTTTATLWNAYVEEQLAKDQHRHLRSFYAAASSVDDKQRLHKFLREDLWKRALQALGREASQILDQLLFSAAKLHDLDRIRSGVENGEILDSSTSSIALPATPTNGNPPPGIMGTMVGHENMKSPNEEENNDDIAEKSARSFGRHAANRLHAYVLKKFLPLGPGGSSGCVGGGGASSGIGATNKRPQLPPLCLLRHTVEKFKRAVEKACLAIRLTLQQVSEHDQQVRGFLQQTNTGQLRLLFDEAHRDILQELDCTSGDAARKWLAQIRDTCDFLSSPNAVEDFLVEQIGAVKMEIDCAGAETIKRKYKSSFRGRAEGLQALALEELMSHLCAINDSNGAILHEMRKAPHVDLCKYSYE
ncbi:unnamed protein product [Amoebophrya sp. A25]|nr:unnamed protein product [Amoebophrya sp. A25]|eukprot:GSA25T00007010001.1